MHNHQCIALLQLHTCAKLSRNKTHEAGTRNPHTATRAYFKRQISALLSPTCSPTMEDKCERVRVQGGVDQSSVRASYSQDGRYSQLLVRPKSAIFQCSLPSFPSLVFPHHLNFQVDVCVRRLCCQCVQYRIPRAGARPQSPQGSHHLVLSQPSQLTPGTYILHILL